MMHHLASLTEGIILQGILLGLYFLFLKNLTFFRINRFLLLTIIFIPFILPPVISSTAESIRAFSLPEFTFSAGNMIQIVKKADTPGFFTAIYLAISGLLLIVSSVRTLLIFKAPLVLVTNKFRLRELNPGEAPFSFMNTIFINSTLPEEERDVIIRHELVHIRQKHSLDLLLVNAFICLYWFNPFLYMIRRELSCIHEYLADKSSGNEKKTDYIKSLLAAAMGTSSSGLLSPFSQGSSIRRRIRMLTKTPTNMNKLSLYLLPALVFSLFTVIVSCNDREQKESFDEFAHKHNLESVNGKLKDGDVYLGGIDKMPEFPGGDEALFTWLGENLAYPETAADDGIEGTVFVSFDIDENGKAANAKIIKGVSDALNAEAKRIVEKMPSWTPGELEGKKVKVRFTLPINFKLEETRKEV